MEAIIQSSIDVSNSAYTASQVNTQLRLAHMAETNYTESGMGTDLSRLRAQGDGHMDEAHALKLKAIRGAKSSISAVTTCGRPDPV